jgi:nucleoside-triphosphatase THEP1
MEKPYFEKLNFTDTPFFPEPIKEVEKNPKGFINREKNLREIRMLLDDSRGFLMLTGDVGTGKTSLLKRVKFFAKEKGMLIIDCDVPENYGFISFFERLFDKIQFELVTFDKIEDEEKEQIRRVLSYQKKSDKENFTLMEEQERAELIKRKMEMIDNFLFSKFPCVIIADGADKLDNEKFKKFIGFISNIPKSVLFLTTSNYSQLNAPIMKSIQQNFDYYSTLDRIKTEREMRIYIEGRIKNYSRNNEVKLIFGNMIYSTLFNRTFGNLRESFRYLRQLLMRLSQKITSEETYEEVRDNNLKRVIKDTDKMVLQLLEQFDKEVLLILAIKNNQDVYSITKKYNERYGTKYNDSKIRNIMDKCAQLGLVHKITKIGRGAKTLYCLPDILIDNLKL